MGDSCEGGAIEEITVATDKVYAKDDLRDETLAQSLALEQGVDLYRRALQISKRQAKKMLAERQGEKGVVGPLDDVLEDLTDDE